MRIQKDRIYTSRLKKGWTQEHLADVAGVSVRTIQRVEASGTISADTAQALCAVLDLSIGEIVATEADYSSSIHGSRFAITVGLGIGFAIGIVIGVLL